MNCGTYAGYQAHRRRGEPACEECKRANREYMALHRQRPGIRDLERRRQNARDRAAWRLIGENRERFARLYIEEMRAS